MSSGCSRTASLKLQKMMPTVASFSLYVVVTLTESKTTSTATPARAACSWMGTPSFSKVRLSSGSTSSMEAYLGALALGAL